MSRAPNTTLLQARSSLNGVDSDYKTRDWPGGAESFSDSNSFPRVNLSESRMLGVVLSRRVGVRAPSPSVNQWQAIQLGLLSRSVATSPVRLRDLPSFNHDLNTKLTLPPNPGWSWCQKTDSTPHGREWMEGEKQGWKTVATAEEDPAKVYALMISGIVPRPIAFVSTVSEDGVENLAPFSWFGMISHHPPVIAFSCLDADSSGSSWGGDRLKDTTRNIMSGGGFVVNIISEPFIEQANATSIDAPLGVSEWALSGLTKMPSIHVKAPRVKESAFSMECELYQTSTVPIVDPASRSASVSGMTAATNTTSTRSTTTLILAHVKYIHARKDVLNSRGTVDISKLKPVSRLANNAYARVGDSYRLSRPSWAADGEKVKEVADAAGDQ